MGADQLAANGSHEVIVIVRDRNDPAASRVMTLGQPTAELMQLIHQQSR
jgi:hypothetical protein